MSAQPEAEPTELVVRAPGKLMVAGEYAVLEGAEALVAAVGAPLFARLCPGRARVKEEEPAEARATRDLAEGLYGPVEGALRIDAEALRRGERKLGLGSSAAGAAATAALIACAHGLDPVEEQGILFRIAFAGHRAISPEGSGADVAAACYGGLIAFSPRGGSSEGPRIESLGLPPGLHVGVWWTGIPVRTSTLVAKVKAAKRELPGAYARAMGELREAAVECAAAWRAGRLPELLVALDRHHRAEAALGEVASAPIVTPTLEALAQRARSLGGAAKPSGAGGGDVALSFFDDAEAHARLCAEAPAGLTLLDLKLGARGAR